VDATRSALKPPPKGASGLDTAGRWLGKKSNDLATSGGPHCRPLCGESAWACTRDNGVAPTR
jgi:hypothetical protein